jgi:choline dehydrogenase-like flavoprotein
MNRIPNVAIIGGGPTGISLAHSLVSIGFHVDLIEAGGLNKESGELSLDDYHFETPSLIPENAHRLGGGSNLWIGRIGEFLPLDFELLGETREQSFPISYEDIRPYYGQAFELLTGKEVFDSDLVQSESVRLGIEMPANLGLRIIRYANKNFFQDTLTQLQDMANFNLLLNQKCVEIKVINKGDDLERYAVISRSGGKEIIADYDVVILCCGAMQSPSLVLNSPELLGDANSHIAGSFLMEHFDGFAGEVHWNKFEHNTILRRILLNRNRETRNSDGLGVAIKISEDLRSLTSTVNLHLELVPQQRFYLFDPATRNTQLVIFKSLYFLERVWRRLIGEVVKAFLRLNGRARYSVWVKSEILPNPDSTITTSRSGGKSVTHYHHIVSAKSKLEFVRALKILAEEMSLAHVGELRIKPSILDGTDQLLNGHNWHPMGTLRMGLDSSNSICDLNLRVHSRSNVYVADASVFPSGSNANPTFTALALGLRLSRYLEERFKL